MIDKIKKASGSIRFWYLVIAFIAFLLGEYEVISSTVQVGIESFCGISIGVITADKFKK